MGIEISFTQLPKIRKRKIQRRLVITLLALFIVINTVGSFIGAKVLSSLEALSDKSASTASLALEKKLERLPHSDVSIVSKDGLTLKGTYVRASSDSKNTVILIPGLNSSRYSVQQFSEIYLGRGFNVLMYDPRAQGESGGKKISYGYHELEDLTCWINYIWSKYPYGQIGIHGESFGAAAALMEFGLNSDKRVKFYVADCSFTSMKDLISYNIAKSYNIKNKYLQNIMFFYTDLICRVKNGYSLNKISPLDSIKQYSTPVLFIHGSADKIVPSSMSKTMYENKKGTKDIYIMNGADHGLSYASNPEQYKKVVNDFLDKIYKQ